MSSPPSTSIRYISSLTKVSSISPGMSMTPVVTMSSPFEVMPVYTTALLLMLCMVTAPPLMGPSIAFFRKLVILYSQGIHPQSNCPSHGSTEGVPPPPPPPPPPYSLGG